MTQEQLIAALKKALAYAISEADGWYDDCRGGSIETEEMDDARALLDVEPVASSVPLPSGWHAVPEHPTERQIVAGSAAMNSADRYRRMVLAAPKLPGM